MCSKGLELISNEQSVRRDLSLHSIGNGLDSNCITHWIRVFISLEMVFCKTYSNLYFVVLCLSLVSFQSISTANRPKYVTLNTNMGDIRVELFWESAPKTCENFAGLAKKGYYDNTIFHRVIDGFMIQGGDPTGTGRGGKSLWNNKFEDEFDSNLQHDGPGVLSMANAGPDTNGSQFFITLADASHLNGKHTIFGRVRQGMDVVRRIGKVRTGPHDRPRTDVTINGVKLTNWKPEIETEIPVNR